MAFDDDTEMETVVQTTVAALNDGAMHVGKADRKISEEQIVRIEAAVKQLQSMLDLKRRMNTVSGQALT